MSESLDIIPVSARAVIGGEPELIDLPQGFTISEMLDVTGMKPWGLRVFVDDRPIHPSIYSIVRPLAGERVFICVVPQGGDTNKTLRTVALIGVMILSIYASGGTAAFGFAGGSTGFGALAGVAVSIGGSLLVNALIPPATPDTPQLSSTALAKQYGISGASNRYLPFQSIPKTLGTDRVYPPYAAKPYTDLKGNTQYVNMLFCLGRGPLTATDLKFGNTDIYTYDGIEVQFGSGRVPPRTFRHGSIFQSTLSILLDVDETPGAGHAGITATEQTTDGDATRIGIELSSPSCYFVRTDGGVNLVRVELEIKYRVNGTTPWIDVVFPTAYYSTGELYTRGNRWYIYGYPSTSSRWGKLIIPLPEATYDISIRRVMTTLVGFIHESDLAPGAGVLTEGGNTPNPDQLFDDIYLVSIKTYNTNSYIDAPDDMELVSVRARATEQLNGVPDNFNLLISASHPVYTASFPTNYIFESTANGFAITNGVMTLDNKWINVAPDPENFMRDDTGALVQDDNLKYITFEDTDFDISLSSLSIVGSTIHDIEIGIRQSDHPEVLTNRLYWSTSGHGFTTSYYMEFEVTTVGVFETITLDMSSPTVGGTDWTDSTITGLKLEFLTIDYGENYDISFLRIQDSTTQDWTYLPTSNPAWQYAEVLTGTSNHRAKTLASLDGPTLATWAAECDTNGYTYNNTISDRSLREMMRVICAAGRAAWTILSDGSYSVIYDGAQTNIHQVFSPRNSWGFKGHKPFIEMPHALRVSFKDKDEGYEVSERIVYADGYTSANATLFESMEFDGINDAELIWKFGRYSFAQAQLRPENYSLNVDIEGLAAVRGNRIRMAHDVPMWGTGWARVKTINIDGTNVTLTIDDEVIFEDSTSYSILIRTDTGNPIGTATTPGLGTEAMVNGALENYTGTQDDGTTDDFTSWSEFQNFGTIEATATVNSGSNAMKLTSNGTSYGGFAYEAVTVEENNYYQLEFYTRGDGTNAGSFWIYDQSNGSDVISITSTGVTGTTYTKVTRIIYTPENCTQIRFVFMCAEVTSMTCYFDDASVKKISQDTLECVLSTGNSALLKVGDLLLFGESDGYYQDLIIKNVYPQGDLAVRLDLIDYNPDIYNDTTVYGTIPDYDTNITIPANWEGLSPPTPRIDSITSDETVLIATNTGAFLSQMVVLFSMVTAEDIAPADTVECQYRVNEQGFPWRTAPVQSASSPEIFITNVTDGVNYDVRIRFITKFKVPSDWVETTHTVIGKTSKPPQVLGFTAIILDNQVNLTWTASIVKDIKEYEVRYGDASATWETATSWGTTYSTSFSRLAQWIGFRQFFIKAVDTTGNESLVASTDDITIVAPTIIDLSAQVVDNNVLFRWTNGIGTLPISHIELRKGTNFDTATVIGQKKGTFTTTFENIAGQYKYWIVAVDTAENYGIEASATATVDEPPDYVLNQRWEDGFENGVGTNVLVLTDGTAIAPCDTTETLAEYFINNGYTTWQDAIDNGEIYLIEPVPTTAEYYEEFNHGLIITSSRVVLDLDETNFNGGPDVTEYLGEKRLVADAYTETTDNPAFLLDFQYVRDRFAFISEGNNFAILNNHSIRLDVKVKEDSGTGTVTIAANGAAITFSKSFADIMSIDISAAGTSSTPLIAIYDFTDVPNPTGFTGYLFTTAGVLATGTFSWTAKGY